jgi:hypothetical protein
MEKLRTSPSGRTVGNSLVGLTRKTFSLFALAVTLTMAIWLANPGTRALGQSDCGLRCQFLLFVCMQGGGGGCESDFDNCIEGCTGV